MNCLKLKKDKRIDYNVMKNIRNLFRLKKEMDDNIIKETSNPFRLKSKK